MMRWPSIQKDKASIAATHEMKASLPAGLSVAWRSSQKITYEGGTTLQRYR